MKEIRLCNKELRFKIACMPLTLRGTVLTWMIGLDPYFAMSRETYYRHYRILKKKWNIDIKCEYSNK